MGARWAPLVLAAIATAAHAAPPRSEPPPPTASPKKVSPARRAGAVALAVVPGVVARGLGAHTVGADGGARATLITGGVGLGLMAIGGLPLAVTYGSAKLVVPGVHLAVVGAGLFLGSWWSDVFAAAGGDRLAATPRAVPRLEVGASLGWLHDPFLGERGQLGAVVQGWRGRYLGAASARLSDDARDLAARFDGAARVRGRWRRTATAIDVRAAVAIERERDDRLTVATGELAVRGRLAFADLDRALAGTFLDLDAGLGLERVDYAVGDTDVNGVLLARFAWGVYLPRRRGEVALFYDHRREQQVGGLVAGRAAGFFGSVGATGELALSCWTVAASVEVGSAWLTTVGLRRGLP